MPQFKYEVKKGPGRSTSGILDAEIHTSSAQGGVDMRRIASEEDRTLLIGFDLTVSNPETRFPDDLFDIYIRGEMIEHIWSIGDGPEQITANGNEADEQGAQIEDMQFFRGEAVKMYVRQPPVMLIAFTDELDAERFAHG